MILGVIPARGGSKGIIRKNIKSICGKPLVAWSIAAAQKSKLLDDFIVSTEDEEISKTGDSDPVPNSLWYRMRLDMIILHRFKRIALDPMFI